MKTYKTLLFDVDNTLLDFIATEDQALRLLCEQQGLEMTPELKERYQAINSKLWKRLEEGECDINEITTTRFEKLLLTYGQEVDGAELESAYRRFLGQGHQLMDGAAELIAELYEAHNLYIVTNGFAQTQDQRLRDSGLYPFFKDIFTSEAIGFQKPAIQFFNHAFSRIGDFDAAQTLIIGDSLTADIKGGQLAGIDTCWINHNKTQNTTSIIPTYEIQKLDELREIVKGQQTLQTI